MEHESHTQSESSRIEYFKFLIVITGIVVLSTVLAGTDADVFEWMRWFMGVFLIVFSGFKFIGYKMFVMMFAGYDIIAKRFKLYAQAYPFIELALGLAYVVNALPGLRDLLVLVIFAIGSIGVTQEIYYRRSGVYCACLGSVIKLPLSTVSLIEDLAMVIMASYMLAA